MQALHLLLAAVTTFAQGRAPAAPIAPDRVQAPHRVAADLELSENLQGLEGLQGLAQGLQALQGALQSLVGLEGLDALDGSDSDAVLDPADSLWQTGRRALNRGDYSGAADLFGQIIKRYPRSARTPDAYYWAAFALYKTGDGDNLKQARTYLQTQGSRYPRAATRQDGKSLFAQIQSELARQGDQDAIIWVREHAAESRVTAATSATAASPAASSSEATATSSRSSTSCPGEDDEDDVRMQALNGLLQMDADNAVPILKRVLQKRDACSASLRRKAVFLISQKHSDETEDILLDVAQHDPDQEVRGQAVFWLSQVNTERAVGLLDSILRSSTDEEMQDKALFALSQQHSPRAAAALRAYAERADASTETRGKAIFWLGQNHNEENAGYLRSLYAKLTDQELKDKVIFSLSQMGGADNMRWLMDIVMNEQEDVEMRKKALFWVGQSHDTDLSQLAAVYDRLQNQEMKEQLIFVYAQRHEGAALDKLMDIAKRDPSRELRKKALFWIGQSHDPRAARFLEEIINQ